MKITSELITNVLCLCDVFRFYLALIFINCHFKPFFTLCHYLMDQYVVLWKNKMVLLKDLIVKSEHGVLHSPKSFSFCQA